MGVPGNTLSRADQIETSNTAVQIALMTLLHGVTCVNGAQTVSVLPMTSGQLAPRCYLSQSGHRDAVIPSTLYHKCLLKLKIRSYFDYFDRKESQIKYFFENSNRYKLKINDNWIFTICIGVILLSV